MLDRVVDRLLKYRSDSLDFETLISLPIRAVLYDENMMHDDR